MPDLVWLWALLFSLLAASWVGWRTQVKGRKANPSLLAIAISSTLARALALFAIIYLPLIDQPRIPYTIALPITGAIIALSGAVLLLIALRELTRADYQGWQGIPSRLITTGPYRLIRHPASAGFIIIFMGWSLAWGALYCLYAAPVIIIGLALESLWEERNLEKALGHEYREYKGRVGMYLPKTRRLKAK